MKAIIYERHNSFENPEDSFYARLEDCREYAKEHGIEGVDEYMDLSSGCLERKKRPELAQLLEDSKDRNFDMVIVAEMSCLSHCYFETILCLKTLRENGVIRHSVRQFLVDRFRPVEECYKLAFDQGKCL